MENEKAIVGFSKLSKTGKIKWIADNLFNDPAQVNKVLQGYWHSSA